MEKDPQNTKGPEGPIARSDLSARLKVLEGRYPSRAEALRAYGVAKTTYDKWLYEKSSPSLESIAKIAKAASVSLDWLAFGEGQGPDSQPPVIDRAALCIDNERINKIINSFNALYRDLAGKYDVDDLHPELDRVIAMYNLTIDIPDIDELDRGLKIAMKMHGDSLVEKAKARREAPPETTTTKRRA